MRTSDTQTALLPALFAAKQAFPVIQKDKSVSTGKYTFKYAPIDVIMHACEPHLYANDLIITQGTEGHELVTRLEHRAGEWRETRMPVNAEHANPQSYGIELTYKRRYSYQMILGIVTEDDTDGKGALTRRGDGNHLTRYIGAKRMEELADVALHMIDAHKSGKDIDAIRTYYGLSDNEEKLYLWGLLKTESALRRIVKANAPQTGNGASQ